VKRVGVLTGGGDVPGLNSAIKAFVNRLEGRDWEVVGLRKGWSSLINIVPDDAVDNSKWIVPLTPNSVRTIDRSGGTILHTSRLNPSIVRPDRVPGHLKGSSPEVDGLYDLTSAAMKTIEHLRLDVIVAIGGDGTLTFARRLHQEGVPVVAIPKTMDNDVYGTDYCIGFSTAVTRSVSFIADLRTAAGSHERFLVVELFGRYSGETCLLTAYLASTDRAVIAEVPFDFERLHELLARDKGRNPSGYAVLAVSEGALPVGGNVVASGEPDVAGNARLGGIGHVISSYLEKQSHDRVIYQRLAYLMRSGAPDSLDQLVANNFGALAADLTLAGDTGKMVAIEGGRYTAVPILLGGEGIKRVDVDRFYDSETYRPKVANVMGLPMFLH
jgi:ATP-dependent phosphofructokinase / diphosphate-dependent phosphofructokinase